MAGKSGALKPDRQVRILLMDHHPIVRKGLRQLIAETPDLSVCGEVEHVDDALQAVEELKPDLAVIDLSLPGANGFDLIAGAKARHPPLLVLVLSTHGDAFYVERALRAGARGYVTTDEATEKIVTAIRRLLNEEVYISDEIASTVLLRMVGSRSGAGAMSVEKLSNRELEVFELIGRGLGTREVAKKLHLSIKTIETHRENIKKKLNVQDASHLLRQAFLWREFHSHRSARHVNRRGGSE